MRRAAAFLLISLAAACAAEDAQFTHYSKVRAYAGSRQFVFENRVNLRAEPSTQAAILCQPILGEELSVLEVGEQTEEIGGISAPWYRVECQGKEGYLWGGLFSTIAYKIDVDGDGSEELLLARGRTSADHYFDDYMVSNRYEYKLCRKGRLLSDAPFGTPPRMNRPAFEMAYDGGFSPQVGILVASQEGGDGEGSWTSYEYFAVTGYSFSYIFECESEYSASGGSSLEVLFPSSGAPTNTIKYELRRRRLDPKTGESISVVEARKVFKWNGKAFLEVPVK